MFTIPVLETERLTLRGFQPSDKQPFVEAMGKDEFARTITREGRGLSPDEAWRAMAMVNGSWSLDGFGNWVVELRETGQPIGRLGPFSPPGWPGFEVGWAIFPEFQRRGYAAEGVAAALIWCQEVLGRDPIIHCILKGNAGSEALAARLGAEPVRDWQPPWGGDVTIWETRREAFIQSIPYQRHIAASGETT
ncbi:GNAT family N-acetyltransferase [Altericroceibacterium endophyticum]|uniref:GNAT family N-acetyltransferase n=1 Tax=Altericroceibacterium endophyticum TaxID=1808508 RepID=A0A6I4T4C8_9SPHN|nr:GNAT family N-acetyltransferase [Altericroceibacterium endophyticum]MXO65726.1 GNAT family N-acetyltransferase [Altericroceibacterium endophyticum]